MSCEAKTRIYKTCVRPIMTYAAETRADTRKTKIILRTDEMRTLRTIAGHTLREYNEQIRSMCDTQDIIRWIRQRRRRWNEHVSRMDEDRLAKIARDGRLLKCRRPPDRPPKQWKDS